MATAATLTQHGTCIAINGLGLLLQGPPGSGKSSLALRLIDSPGYGLGSELLVARLVADDQVVLSRDGNELWASAPPRLAGLIEVRGIGILPTSHEPRVRLALAVALMPVAQIERLPEPETLTLLGCQLPLIRVDANLAEAPARLRAMVTKLLHTG